MRPLVVLVIVLAALAVFIFAFVRSGGDQVSPVSPGTREQAAAVDTPEASLAAPPRQVAQVAEEPTEEARTEIPSDTTGGYSNSLNGTVLNGESQPVDGAEVILTDQPMMGEYLAEAFFSAEGESRAAEPPAVQMTARTDGSGRYQFRSIEPRSNYYLIASHSKYSRAQEARVFVGEEGEFKGPDIVLRPGSVLAGYVMDITGSPIDGAAVHVDSAYMLGKELQSPDRVSGQTDASGYYEITNVPSGACNVSVEAAGFGMQVRHNLVFRGVPEERENVDFRLEVGQAIGGRVLGADGLGIPGAHVLALSTGNNSTSRGEVETDEIGEFLIQGLQSGNYMMMVDADGFRQIASRGSRCNAGETDVELRMVSQAKVTGRVMDTATGKGVERFTCIAQYVDETGTVFEGTSVKQSFQGSDGTFELQGLDPGSYVIQAQAKGFAPTRSEPFTITQNDADVAGLVIRISKGGSITGRIVDAGGQPVAGALVITRDNQYVDNPFNDMLAGLMTSSVTKSKTRSNSKGAFTLDLLTPEKYQIHIQHPDYTDETHRDIAVLENMPADVGDITLRAGGTIQGTMRDEAGQILPRGHVTLQGDDGITAYSVRSDNQGRYKFRHVRAGSYKLSGSRVAPGSGGDVFSAIVDQKNSEVSISVFDGGEVTQDLNLGG